MSHVSGSVAEKRAPVKPPAADRLATLVWIDSREAHVVRWRNGAATTQRFESDVPVHRRATGGAIPNEAVEGRRLEHLARFLTQVAGQIAHEDDVVVLGPGTVREHFERELTTADRKAHRARKVSGRPARHMTVPQLVAALRAEIGDPPRRKRVGSHQSDGRKRTEPVIDEE